MVRTRRTATDSLLVLFVNASSAFFLSSCNNDRSAAPGSEEQVAQSERERPVFGQPPAESRARVAPKPAEKRELPQVREQSQARARSRENRTEQTSQRFLYYRPPGSPVGDPGELQSAARQPTLPPE